MRMKRKLVTLVAPLLVVVAVPVIGATTANAATTMTCGPINLCVVHEDMGSGYCEATIKQADSNGYYDPNGNFANASSIDWNTGYACNFFLQRNVNESGWYNIDTYSAASSVPFEFEGTPNEWNGLNYAARICLQFNWGSSLGTLHCSLPVSIIPLSIP